MMARQGKSDMQDTMQDLFGDDKTITDRLCHSSSLHVFSLYVFVNHDVRASV